MQESLVNEFKEAHEVVALAGIGPGKFAYTLGNCTVGVYKDGSRAWRVKSKNAVHCICVHDFSGSGEMQLASGWSNGKVHLTSAS